MTAESAELHLKDLATVLHKFQRENILCDTVLITDDREVWAHSVILAAISPYVYKKFLSITGTGPKAKYMFKISLAGCDSVSVEAVMRFFYTGSLVLPTNFQQSDKFSGLVRACEKLGISMSKLNGTIIKFEEVELHSNSEMICNDGQYLREEKEVTCQELSHNFAANDDDLHRKCDVFEKTGIDETDGESYVHLSDFYIPVDFVEDANSQRTDTVDINTAECNQEPVSVPLHNDELISTESSSGVEKHSRVINISLIKRPKVNAVKNNSMTISNKRSENIKKNEETEDYLKRQSIFDESSPIDQNIHDKTVQKKYVCLTCGKKFSLPACFGKHLDTHAMDSMSSCKQVNKASEGHEKLRTHETLDDHERPYVCITCGKTYRHRSSLTQHVALHYEKHPYLCELCGMSFVLAVTLRRHVMSRHSNIRPFVCKECGTGFVRDYLLRDHMEKHTGKKSNVCPQCGLSFSHRGNLTRHLRLHEADDQDKQHICSVCNRAFNRKSNMQKHMLSHTKLFKGLKQRTCPLCQKTFSSETLLKRHSLSHSTECASYVCNICGMACFSPRCLLQHMIIHEEKQFMCQVCSKMFSSEQYLLVHSRKHNIPNLMSQ